MSKTYDSEGLAEKLGGTLSDVDAQRPPATAQSQQWRKLAERVREHPCQCCAEGGYRSNCSCDEQHLMAALITAADAYDSLEERLQYPNLPKEREFAKNIVDANTRCNEHIVRLEADNAALRELLAKARTRLADFHGVPRTNPMTEERLKVIRDYAAYLRAKSDDGTMLGDLLAHCDQLTKEQQQISEELIATQNNLDKCNEKLRATEMLCDAAVEEARRFKGTCDQLTERVEALGQAIVNTKAEILDILSTCLGRDGMRDELDKLYGRLAANSGERP